MGKRAVVQMEAANDPFLKTVPPDEKILTLMPDFPLTHQAFF